MKHFVKIHHLYLILYAVSFHSLTNEPLSRVQAEILDCALGSSKSVKGL